MILFGLPVSVPKDPSTSTPGLLLRTSGVTALGAMFFVLFLLLLLLFCFAVTCRDTRPLVTAHRQMCKEL